MTIRISEMVTSRIGVGGTLKAGLETTYLPEIAQGYSDYFAPLLEEGETMIDVGFHLVLLKRSVDWNLRTLEELDWGVLGQNHDDDKVRAEIDKLTTALDLKVRSVRHVCRGCYGPPSLERVGLKGDLRRSPSGLYRQAKIVKASLEVPDLGLEPILDFSDEEEGPVLTPARLAARLEPELGKLGLVIDTRDVARKETTDAVSRRRQTIRDFDRNIGGIVRMAQGIFRLAGRNDLARRFRSTARRVTRRLAEVQQAEEPAEPAAEPPTS